MILFHIATQKDMDKALNQQKDYTNISLKKDGFIHCSTFEQLESVANNNFKNTQEFLVVICLNTDYLNFELKWEENLKNGHIFPHIYGPINHDCIIDTIKLEKDISGNFIINDKLQNYSKYEKSCGAIIAHKFDNEYKFLLIGSNWKSPFKNKLFWGFPKGHVENNETELETAKREVHEEVGLDIKLIPGFRASTHFSYKKGYILEAVYYAATTESTNVKIQPSEVNEYKWCNLKDVYNYLSFECDKKIFNQFENFLNKYPPI